MTSKAVHFFKPEDIGPRDWGREILVAHVQGCYTGKVLLIKAGAKGGLQKHHLKNETAYLFSGRMKVRFDVGDGVLQERVLEAGESVHIPPGAVHQEEAIEDCVVFETSTPHFNDRERVEEKYGLPVPVGGLPSTRLDEVETK